MEKGGKGLPLCVSLERDDGQQCLAPVISPLGMCLDWKVCGVGWQGQSVCPGDSGGAKALLAWGEQIKSLSGQDQVAALLPLFHFYQSVPEFKNNAP